MESNNLAYLLALHEIPGVGALRLVKLLKFFEDPKLAFEASEKDWQAAGFSPFVIQSWKKYKGLNIDPLSLVQDLKKRNISVVTIFDVSYPKLLKEIYDPPVILYCLGDINALDGVNIAIVGSRKMTGYGKLVTEKFSSYLSSLGITIVSGLARGVDSAAHASCIEANGKTVAVLGGGLSKIFPPENERLAQKIAQGFGVVISEFSPKADSLPGNFPARNRIISGLSRAVLVTEAAEDSGSLITAKLALDQGREVFSVPGPITSSQSLGNLQLLKNGATLVTTPEEILDHLGLQRSEIKPQSLSQAVNLSERELLILTSLALESKHIDEICLTLKLSAAVVCASLVKMELLGIVKNLGGGNYLKVELR